MERPTSNSEETPGVRLERATSADVEAYLAVETGLAGISTYVGTGSREQALKEIEENTVYLIRNNGSVVGRVGYEMRSSDHAYISDLVIHSDFQGRGIGKTAMEMVLKELADVPTIDLVTHPENTKAVQLYQSLGFTVGERTENYFGDGEPRIVMTLRR